MSLLKIEVEKEKPEHISGVSKGGKEYSIWKQKAYAHLPSSKYPVMIELNIEDEAHAYKEGIYTIDPSSFYVGDFNSLSLRFMKLVPLTDVQLKAVG